MRVCMLAPDKNRVDYGEQLIAPKGYELTNAIATTYSLDLNTLLTVPIAICFGHTLEGAVEHMRIALLDALATLGDKLTVFYQQGNIKLPDKYNSLFGLLENSLVPVVPNAGNDNSAFSSFHPKLWLLRFKSTDSDANIKYRLIVLSRNLTFDRSWDLSAVINGESRGKRKPTNKPLIAFFDQLYESASDENFSDVIDSDELLRVLWQKPNNIQNIEFLSTIFDGGKRQCPINIPHSNLAMLAVSPFIRGGSKVDALDWLKDFTENEKRYLFCRKEELDMAGEEALLGWNCYAFNEHLVNAEENEEMEQSQFFEHDLSLHAKLLVVDENDYISSWHIGSANMTQAAIGDEHRSPRNSEFMLRLSGDRSAIGVDALIQLWVNEDNTGLFIPHEFSKLEDDQDEKKGRALRLLEYKLINTHWLLEVDSCNDAYQLSLTTSNSIEVPDGFDIQVSILSVNQLRPLAEQVIWDKFKLSQISALLRLDILQAGEVVKQLVTQGELSYNCDVDRSKAITNELLDNASQFMSYISMLLQINPSKEDLMCSISNQSSVGSGDNFFAKDSVIFEKLMSAAATEPELLVRINKLKMQIDEKIIPKEFKALWSVFSQLVEPKSSPKSKNKKMKKGAR